MNTYRNRVFPLLAGALWACFLLLDLLRLGESTWIKYAGICLCCLTALLGTKTTDGKLVALALCFTLGADWFLLVLDRHYTTGISLFLLVQFIYAYRLYLCRGKHINHSGLSLRMALLILSLLAVLFPAAVFHHWWEGPSRTTLFQDLWRIFTAWLPLFYFSNLAVNTYEAFALGKRYRTFALGLLLFVCCDLCVGAWNLGLLPGFTRVGMWLFYLPSQVLIVLSQGQEMEEPHEKRI